MTTMIAQTRYVLRTLPILYNINF